MREKTLSLVHLEYTNCINSDRKAIYTKRDMFTVNLVGHVPRTSQHFYDNTVTSSDVLKKRVKHPGIYEEFNNCNLIIMMYWSLSDTLWVSLNSLLQNVLSYKQRVSYDYLHFLYLLLTKRKHDIHKSTHKKNVTLISELISKVLWWIKITKFNETGLCYFESLCSLLLIIHEYCWHWDILMKIKIYEC